MGMDFLRRLDMKLFTGNKSSKAYLLLGGVNFPIKYTGEDSLGCVSVPSVVEVAKERRATQTLRIAPVHVVQTEFIEPKSGQFVSAAVARGLPESRAILVEGTNPKFIVPRSISAVQGRRTSVWVVNPDAKQRKLTQGTCIGFAEQVGAEQLVDVSAEGNVTGKEPRVKEDTVTHPSSTGHAGRDFSPEAAEFSQPKFTDATTQVHSLAEIDADELAPRSCKVWPADEQVAECPSDTSDDDIELYSLPCSQDEALAVNENHSVNSDTPVNLATLASAVLREYQLKEDLWKEIIEFLEAHPGALRTYHNLQNSYFFPNMFRLCKWYVQHCTACQHRKGSRERAEMQCRPPPSGPLELVSADLMDLRASVGGYRYVLSIVDHHPDNDRQWGEFANEQWQEVCRQLEIRCSFTIAYHPSSNGLVERTNRVVKDALAMLVADKPGRWPLYLTSVREANAQAHNRKVRSTWQPEEGALVLRRDFTGGALQDRWQGPCRVIKQIGPVVFEVKDLQPPYRIVKQHRDQLKMYLPPAELDYVEVGDRLPSDPPGVDGPLPGRPPDVAAPVHVLDDFGYDRTEDEFSNSGPLNRSPSVYHFLYSGADMSTETNNDYSDYEVWEE
ncbi:hypothetical protein C7M84_020963 [Penaeus vannamei]|uniref:Integrase catalytic domain-containing protein n=1 Tax=Penaeus vannamei TaxID=6689 RepID=A0A3R7LRV9_PENVA|nr:hypothetical protein C7M84_020963 [Penaeus vannamei]